MDNNLTLDNILTSESIDDLFGVDETASEDTTEQQTTEVDLEEFLEDKPESVGSEENKEEKENLNSGKNGTSPKTNFYSSIAKALKEDGILPDLEDKNIEDIKEPEDFAKTIEDLVTSRLDTRMKQIEDALSGGADPSELKEYESTLTQLDSIKEDFLSQETQEAGNLRNKLIFQDYINRGYSKERAQREVQKSINGGTEIEDAKEALVSNKEYFKNKYDDILAEAKTNQEKILAERKQQADLLKKGILEDKEILEGVKLDTATRKKVFENLSKPVFKDPESGEYLTAIQKYEKENRVEFMKKLGVIFTMTDGFKTIDKLISGKVNKEVRKSIRELENTINNTSRTTSGNLDFASGVNGDDSDSYSSNIILDV